MRKIGSILCDGGERKDYRRNIYLVQERLFCDGNDITPHCRTYTDIKDARRDVRTMYSCSIWKLELV